MRPSSARAATRAFVLGPTPVGRWRETLPDAVTPVSSTAGVPSGRRIWARLMKDRFGTVIYVGKARDLRRRGLRNRIGFFLHTPWPARQASAGGRAQPDSASAPSTRAVALTGRSNSCSGSRCRARATDIRMMSLAFWVAASFSLEWTQELCSRMFAISQWKAFSPADDTTRARARAAP